MRKHEVLYLVRYSIRYVIGIKCKILLNYVVIILNLILNSFRSDNSGNFFIIHISSRSYKFNVIPNLS